MRYLGDRLRSLWRTLWRFNQLDTDMREEMRFHLQMEADRLAKGEGGPVRADLPKGLSRETADLVRRALSRDEALSSTECAERVGISRVSARRYLEYLVSERFVRPDLVYGSVGRPERRYSPVAPRL